MTKLTSTETEITVQPDGRYGQVFGLFFWLGCSSFGGPVAHLEVFRRVFVEQRRWFSAGQYADLVALCQFLPGPASSQTGIAIGLLRAGYPGAFCAWLGFTLPSALLLAAFAWLLLSNDGQWLSGLGQGLAVATVAVVAQALVGMGRTLAPDWPRRAAALGCALMLLWGEHWAWQLFCLLLGAGFGWTWYRRSAYRPANTSLDWRQAEPYLPSRQVAIGWLLLCAALLLLLPLLAQQLPLLWLQLSDSLYRSGALVFGGGHVVLPLLQAQAVPAGWLSDEQFLAGYGAAQLVPGPLFSFATFIGSLAGGWQGAIVATVAIFLPAWLLVVGALPFWLQGLRQPGLQAACCGIHAVVLGFLLAAFIQPVLSHGIRSWLDAVQALLAFVALQYGRLPVWLVVPFTASAVLLVT